AEFGPGPARARHGRTNSAPGPHGLVPWPPPALGPAPVVRVGELVRQRPARSVHRTSWAPRYELGAWWLAVGRRTAPGPVRARPRPVTNAPPRRRVGDSHPRTFPPAVYKTAPFRRPVNPPSPPRPADRGKSRGSRAHAVGSVADHRTQHADPAPDPAPDPDWRNSDASDARPRPAPPPRRDHACPHGRSIWASSPTSTPVRPP